jgi:hypothetical protein
LCIYFNLVLKLNRHIVRIMSAFVELFTCLIYVLFSGAVRLVSSKIIGDTLLMGYRTFFGFLMGEYAFLYKKLFFVKEFSCFFHNKKWSSFVKIISHPLLGQCGAYDRDIRFLRRHASLNPIHCWVFYLKYSFLFVLFVTSNLLRRSRCSSVSPFRMYTFVSTMFYSKINNFRENVYFKY